MLREKLMIRRLKKDVLGELPSKTRQRIIVKCDDKLVNRIKRKLEVSFRSKAHLKKYLSGEPM